MDGSFSFALSKLGMTLPWSCHFSTWVVAPSNTSSTGLVDMGFAFCSAHSVAMLHLASRASSGHHSDRVAPSTPGFCPFDTGVNHCTISCSVRLVGSWSVSIMCCMVPCARSGVMVPKRAHTWNTCILCDLQILGSVCVQVGKLNKYFFYESRMYNAQQNRCIQN